MAVLPGTGEGEPVKSYRDSLIERKKKLSRNQLFDNIFFLES